MADRPVKRGSEGSGKKGAVRRGEGIPAGEPIQAPQHREGWFRAMFDLAKDVIFIYDEEGRILEANREACERLGYSRDELLHMKPFEIDTPGEAALFPGRMEVLRRQGYHLFEAEHQRRDGTVIPVEVSVRLFESAGRLLSLSVCRDITERKRAGEALRASEEKFRSLVETTSDWVWEMDKTGTYTYASPKVRDLLGYEPEEVVGKTPFEFMPPDERARIGRIFREARQAGLPLNSLENVNIHKNGQRVYLETSAVPIIDAGGTLVGYRGIDRDITERKRAEEALRESEEKYRAIVEQTTEWIWEIDLNRVHTYSNHAIAAILGYDMREFLGLNSDSLLHAEDRAAVDDQLPRLMAEKRGWRGWVLRWRHKDGSYRSLESNANPVLDATGRLLGYRGVDRDITERKRAGEALRASEEKFRGIYEGSPIGIELYDGDGTLLDANRACLDIFGISGVAEVKGFKLFEDPNLTEDFKVQLRRGESVRYVIPFDFEKVRAYNLYQTTKKGVIYLDLLITPLKGTAAGSTVGYLVHVRDITDRKQIELQMREIQKFESLGVLAGGIAHDFNNLLMAILGNADLALLSLSPVSPAHRYVEEIILASQRAADLCRQMLAYSGKGSFVVGRHDVSEIIREMEQILAVSVSKKAMLRYVLSEGLPPVESDATQIRQVIMNLITNASDALGDASGVITVTTGVAECDEAYLAGTYLNDNLPGGTYITVEVSDTGCGVDAETKSRIFDPFFTTKFTGRGLGLAAVLGIVRGHKGAIKVYSELGTGTTVKILLPATEQEPGEAVRIPEQIGPLQGGGTVLLVDDDPTVRAVAAAMLAKLGFRVLTANNGREGLKVFRAHGAEIVCVLLDLMMPEMGGEETFRELRNLRSDVRVILSSGYNEQEATQRFVGRGLSGFVQKPYTTANLHSVLKSVLC